MRAPLLFALICLTNQVYGQKYPQGYFRNPLGIPIFLAGNFGECRPGHFHMGLDLKTEGRENLPVYAAADGYVSRIKTEPGGFGHAIYLTHPNGYTTVYAHLNDFFPALQKRLRSLQYARENWTVDETLKPEQFPVKKGQQIAWSGNTGGSTAPHLHFEIRDTKTERALNPQLFGFDIKDTKPPVPTELFIYDATRSIYYQEPRRFALRKTSLGYEVDGPAIGGRKGSYYFGIIGDDFMDGSTNTLAFYRAEWSVDGKSQGSIALDEIGYEETRYLHAYADYGAKQRLGKWVQLLYRLPGNKLTRLYSLPQGVSGAVLFTSASPTASQLGDTFQTLNIVLTDAAGNKTEISAKLSCNGVPNIGNPYACSESEVAREILDYASTNIRFTLPKDVRYDDFCLTARAAPSPVSLSDRFAVLAPTIPAHSFFPLAIKPSRPVPFAARQKVALMYSDGKKTNGKAAAAEAGGWYTASVRAFGDYWLAADTGAPVIKPIGAIAGNLKGKKTVAFSTTDATTSVKSFRGEIDGQWVLFEQHGDVWTYIFDEHCPPGKHTLVMRATDEVGNETRRSYTFTR